jgi:regulator of cell morphogenesis and NO signaling
MQKMHTSATPHVMDRIELEARPTGELLEQLSEAHHRHVSEVLPFLIPLSHKVMRVHGSRHASLREVHELVVELEETLEPLLDWREKELFPLMLRGTGPHLHTELQAMVAAHLVVTRLFEQLREAADDYLLPADACSSYRLLFQELQALEAEQLTQLRLEQHVLMPRFGVA